jgi:hypothetical protein
MLVNDPRKSVITRSREKVVKHVRVSDPGPDLIGNSIVPSRRQLVGIGNSKEAYCQRPSIDPLRRHLAMQSRNRLVFPLGITRASKSEFHAGPDVSKTQDTAKLVALVQREGSNSVIMNPRCAAVHGEHRFIRLQIIILNSELDLLRLGNCSGRDLNLSTAIGFVRSSSGKRCRDEASTGKLFSVFVGALTRLNARESSTKVSSSSRIDCNYFADMSRETRPPPPVTNSS